MARRTVSAPYAGQYFAEVEAKLQLSPDTVRWHGRIALAADRLGPLSVFTALDDRPASKDQTTITAELASFYDGDMVGVQLTDTKDLRGRPVALGLLARDLWVAGEGAVRPTRLHSPPEDVDPAVLGLGAMVSEEGYAIGYFNNAIGVDYDFAGPVTPYDAFRFINSALERIDQLPPDQAKTEPLRADGAALDISPGYDPGPGPSAA